MTLLLRLSDVTQVEADTGATLPLTPRDAALLAWLALEGPTPRDRLAGLLWPASSPTQARNVLRQRLFQLKKATGRDVATGSPLLALADDVAHDLADAGELLGTLSFADAPEFDAWLARQRQRLQQRETDALHAQAQALEDAGDAPAALSVAQVLLRREPLSEVAHQRVIRLLYLTGDRAAALAAFDACERVLKDELGARPSPQTLALLATVERAQVPRAAGVPPPLPAAVLRPPRMVGREREARTLAQAWAAAQVAAVIGEAGMGKTRLLAEFMVTQPGVVRAAGRPGDAGVPFATLARLLRAVDGAAATLAIDTRNQLARVLPELGGPGAVFAEGQRLQLQRAMQAYLQTAPGLRGLVLDDLHFADEASLEMLQALVVESRQPPWAVAWRPAEAGTPVHALEAALSEAALLAPVVVAPLDEVALATLVDELDLGLEGRAVAPQLLQRTGGNPLFVLETLKQAWVDQRMPELAAGGVLPRPQSVGQLMQRRVAQLSPPALALARVASIAGVDFSLDLAEQVLGTGAMHLADALNELEAAQVLKGLQFAHDLVFDAVLASVPAAIARHTHARTAGFLAQRQAEPARIAEHWLAAGQPLEALPWLKTAAAAAERAGRGKEQCEFLLRAAALEEQLGLFDAAFDTTMAVLHDELHSFVHEPLAVVANLHRLARSDRQRALAFCQHGWRLARDWHLDEARQQARSSLQLAEQSGELPLINDARHQLAIIGAMAGDSVQALTWFDKIADSLQTSGDPAPADFHANYAVALDTAGRARDARRAFALALDEARRRGESVTLILSNMAVNRLQSGEAAAARELADESLALHARDETAPAERAGALLTRARSEQLLGRWRRALETLDQAPVGGHAQQGWLVRLRRCESWLDLGQFARAQGELAELGTHPAVHPKFAVFALCETARALRWSGQPVGDCLDQARARLRGGQQADVRLRVQCESLMAGPVEQVRGGTESIVSEAQALGLDGITMTAWWVRAARLRDESPAEAAAAAQRALALAGDVDTPGLYKPELWWQAALALQADGQQERAHAWVRHAAAWIHARVREGDVPAEFVDSFLHRNPINRELLAWAGRLEAPPDMKSP